jgi:hypothetical protein
MRTDYYEDYEDAFPDSGRKPNGSAHADGWPKPDMSVLQVRRPAPPFPLKLLAPWDRWISDAAESAGAPPDYVVAVLLPALSALLASARAVSPWAGWVEPASFGRA